MYTCVVKYIHPDIVVGEPVPEVEPRVDAVRLKLALMYVRCGRWGTGLIFVSIIVLSVLDASLLVRMIVMGVMLIVGVAVIFQPRHWRLMRLLANGMKAKGEKRVEPWGLPIRVQLELMCYLLIMMSASQGVVSANSGLGGLSSFVAMGGVLIGGSLIMYGFRARQPGQICCVDCAYPLVGLTLACECPECGRMIYDETWTTDRARVRSGWFFGVGGVLIPLGLLSFYVGIFQPSVLYAPVPRAALMQIAPRDRGAFEQLVSRSLSEDETNELIDRLIDVNAGADGWDYSTSAQGRWLSQFVGTAALDGDRLDRIMGRIVEPMRIVGASIGRVGEPIEFRLMSDEIELPSFSMSPRMYFRGFGIDDGAALASGGNEPMRLNRVYGDGRSLKIGPRWTWVPIEAGEYVVRARVAVALLPKSARGSKINWQTDEPVFEASAIWYRVIDLEHRVVVEE